MTSIECRHLLLSKLKTLITSDYILLDLPYFTNIGDVLIWQSAVELLKEIPYKCLYSASIETYHPIKIESTTIILFMGGGNYGDLWERHQIFRRKVLMDYPLNRVIQLPQSVHFNDQEKFQCDIKFMDAHPGGITICLRERKSFDIIRQNYQKVSALLLPDLVLSFDLKNYCIKHKIEIKKGQGSLLVRRRDAEQNETTEFLKKIPEDADVADWPTMIKRPKILEIYNKYLFLLRRFHCGERIQNWYTDFFYKRYIKDAYIQEGIRFLNPYSIVYSTRLHSAILAFLMEKEVILFDNSYGKCKGVYDEWMSDQSHIQMI